MESAYTARPVVTQAPKGGGPREPLVQTPASIRKLYPAQVRLLGAVGQSKLAVWSQRPAGEPGTRDKRLHVLSASVSTREGRSPRSAAVKVK